MRAHGGDELLVLRANVHQHEVCSTGKERHVQLSQPSHHAVAAYAHLFDIPLEIIFIGQCDGQAVESHAIDVVGRTDLAQILHQLRIPCEHSDAQVGETVSLRE